LIPFTIMPPSPMTRVPIMDASSDKGTGFEKSIMVQMYAMNEKR
jgi:hypothetical protein